jgi:hypothetical protein
MANKQCQVSDLSQYLKVVGSLNRQRNVDRRADGAGIYYYFKVLTSLSFVFGG